MNLSWAGSRELTIGRDAECAIHLANTDVSRQHAALRRNDSDSGVLIADLASRNGTRVNGRPVQSARLQENDVVRVGGCVFVVSDTPTSFSEVAPDLHGSASLKRALAPLPKVARSDLAIVLEGETGTGKELVARAIHTLSGRAGKLVAINCAALPQGLAEAELFGYRRGAFTGAERASPGFFRAAEGGTLLLDEVSELPLGLQAKLLRALEQKAVQPLGEPAPVPVDVRIVVAGQSSLFEAVKRQQFRADLLARLNGVTLHLPPLRARRADILPALFALLANAANRRAPSLRTRARRTSRLVRLAVQCARGAATREKTFGVARCRSRLARPAFASRDGPGSRVERARPRAAGSPARGPACDRSRAFADRAPRNWRQRHASCGAARYHASARLPFARRAVGGSRDAVWAASLQTLIPSSYRVDVRGRPDATDEADRLDPRAQEQRFFGL